MQLFGIYTESYENNEFTSSVAICTHKLQIVVNPIIEPQGDYGEYTGASVLVEHQDKYYFFECEGGDLTGPGREDFKSFLEDNLLVNKPTIKYDLNRLPIEYIPVLNDAKNAAIKAVLEASEKANVSPEGFHIDNCFCDCGEIETQQVADIIHDAGESMNAEFDDIESMIVDYLCEKVSDHFKVESVAAGEHQTLPNDGHFATLFKSGQHTTAYQPDIEYLPDTMMSFEVFGSMMNAVKAYPDIPLDKWEMFDFSNGQEPIEDPIFLD